MWPYLATPLDAYRPIPWWAWTGDLNEADLRAQLDTMQAQGLTEFFLFPIYGLEVPYLSAEYWAKVKWTLEECRRRGMKVWIYDEYNWPSGVCAGRVLRDHPEFVAESLRFRAAEVAPGGELRLPVPPDEVAGAYVLDAAGNRRETGFLREGEGAAWWNDTKETLIVWAFWIAPTICGQVYDRGSTWNARVDRYLDVLNPAAVRAFLDSTYGAYHERFPEFYPETVPGYFTDEPRAIYTPHGEAAALPYTPDLFPDFQAQYGYDLRERLPQMVLNVGDYRQVRRDFWGWLADRFGTSFSAQLAGWCERHGVALTGHLVGEEYLTWHVSGVGDFYTALSPFQVPGIDLLENADGYTYRFESLFYRTSDAEPWGDKRKFHVDVKWPHGIVRHAGRREMMSEAFGVQDWGLNLQRQRMGTNYQVALGVTLFNDNSLVFSIADFRKTAIAGKHFTQPWWAHYRQWADYCARVAGLHAEGVPVADVGVLFPRTTLWAEGDADTVGRWVREDPTHRHPLFRVQECLRAVTDALLRRQWPFDFLPEQALAAARVEGKQLVTAVETYRALIVPGATAWPADGWTRLVEFAEDGGFLLFVGDLPTLNLDESDDLAPQVAALLARPNVAALPYPPEAEDFEAALDAALEGRAERPLRLHGPGAREFVSSVRAFGEDRLYFVANMSWERQEVTVELDCSLLSDWEGQGPGEDEPQPGAGQPATVNRQSAMRGVEVWQPDPAERFRPAVEPTPGGLRFDWAFEPNEAYFVTPLVAKEGLGEGRELPTMPLHRRPVIREKVLADGWTLSLEPGNILRLELDLRRDPDNVGWREGWFRDDSTEGWETSRNRRVEQPLDQREVGWYWVRARVQCGPGAAPRLLVVDTKDFLEAYVNGQEAPGLGRFPLWDQENQGFDVSGLFREGGNLVTVRARTSPYYDARVTAFPGVLNLLQPVALEGDFTVTSAGRPQALAAPSSSIGFNGSLTDQGYPHFASVATYATPFTLEEEPPLLTLDFPATRDSVEVWLNGQKVATRPWPPYCVDLTPHVTVGENDLALKVHTTLGNLLKETYGGAAYEDPVPAGLWEPPVLRWREG